MKKRTILYLVSALLLVGIIGTAFYYYQSNTTAKTEQKVLGETTKKEVTYKGQNGVTALSLLEKNAKIETSGTGEMVFVTSINGVKANSKSEYWQLNVDGKSASVGAGSYITKDTETITWKLVTF